MATPQETVYVGGTLSDGQISGAAFAFRSDADQIAELSYVQSVSLDGNEMQSDEIYVTVRVKNSPDAFPAALDSAGISRAAPVWLDRADENGARRLEKYYWKSVERVSRYNYEITAQSPFGRLNSDFPGGLYQGEITLKALLENIAGTVVPVSVDERLNFKAYGYLPYATRREAVHMLSLAYGFIILRGADCNLFFTLPTTQARELPDEIIYNGGSVSYATGKTYARIDVTEYAFLKTENDKRVTLFDNADGSSPAADRQTVKFSEAPVYGLSASDGLTLHDGECGPNCAVVSGVGRLTGKAYAKIASVFSLDGDPNAEEDAVLTIDGVPMITSLNSETVAAKYRSSANAPAVIGMDFVRGSQTPGDLFSFVDPYGTPRTAYLTAISGKISAIDRASAQFLAGYSHYWGNAYNAVFIFTSSGTWTVSPSLDGANIRVALIGGGTGGASGQHGADNGPDGRGDKISGGLHGESGGGGKVRVVEIAAHEGQTFSFVCGAGGAGGQPSDDFDTDDNGNKTYRNNPGASGTASVFALTQSGLVIEQWSSDDGAASNVGYLDILNGVRYAAQGPDNGIDGGAATTATENNDRSNPAYVEPVTTNSVIFPWDPQFWTSGGVGNGWHYHQDKDGDYPAFDNWAYGGLGGGAAVGNGGADGQDAPPWAYGDTGGRGGDGADAVAMFPDLISADNRHLFGSGGSGGHGGGEGGAGGTGHTTAIVLPSGDTADAFDGAAGTGGAGSAGQSGAPGCILLYYRA